MIGILPFVSSGARHLIIVFGGFPGGLAPLAVLMERNQAGDILAECHWVSGARKRNYLAPGTVNCQSSIIEHLPEPTLLDQSGAFQFSRVYFISISPDNALLMNDAPRGYGHLATFKCR